MIIRRIVLGGCGSWTLAILLCYALNPAVSNAEDKESFDFQDIWLNPAWYLPEEVVTPGSDVYEAWQQWKKYPKKIEFSSFLDRVKIDNRSCNYESLGLQSAFVGPDGRPTLSISCDGFKPFLVQEHQTERGRHKPYFLNVKFGTDAQTTKNGFPLNVVGFYRESYFLEISKRYELEKQQEDPDLKDWGSQ